MNEANFSIEHAPIVIHTYTRLGHLKKTINALLENDLAKSTDIFIASDGPRESRDEHKVFLVREYIKSIKGFKSVTAILREKNFGYHQNAVLAFKDVYEKYDRLISIEDDTIVGKGFLRFINDGLSIYRDDKNIFAICGYLDNSVSMARSEDAVLLTGFAAWGFGIWRDRFYEIPNHAELATKFLREWKLFFKLNINRPDLLLGVWAVANDRVVAGDLVSLLHIIRMNKKCLFPTQSLVRNIGNDGTGENCVADPSYGNQPYNKDKILLIVKDKIPQNSSKNPFFLAHGGWSLLIVNLCKYFLLIILGEHHFKKISSLIKQFILSKKRNEIL